MSLSKEWKDRLSLFHKELEHQLFRPVGELRFDGFTTTERLRCEDARKHTRAPMPPVRYTAKNSDTLGSSPNFAYLRRPRVKNLYFASTSAERGLFM